MATDTWLDGTANWNTPGDWSALVHRQLQLAHDLAQALQGRFGFAPSAQDHDVPDAESDVAINAGGYPQVTASFGTVNSITDSGGLDFILLIGPDGVECRVDKNGHWS